MSEVAGDLQESESGLHASMKDLQYQLIYAGTDIDENPVG